MISAKVTANAVDIDALLVERLRLGQEPGASFENVYNFFPPILASWSRVGLFDNSWSYIPKAHIATIPAKSPEGAVEIVVQLLCRCGKVTHLI